MRFSPNARIRHLRKQIFSADWDLDAELSTIAMKVPSHRFLYNPSGQYPFIYLTRFVKAAAEMQLGVSFNTLTVLDWGCGKGHVSKLIRELSPLELKSCDIASNQTDSAFGQQTPIIGQFNISVIPLPHEHDLPFSDGIFDIVLSFGVLEHVANDKASLGEIARILKPGGLFFCFQLPTKLSWTQFISRQGGDHYHDRLYMEHTVRNLVSANKLEILDLWYRGFLPKNRIRYPGFRLFEKLDQLITEYTPLRFFATNIEFVCFKTI
jgi:SAM-dependent methyltransferase